MNAVAYARFSSDKQRDNSIDEQLFEIRQYAVKNGFRVVKEYCDYAVSGASSDREEFNKMLNDSLSGKFEAVLVFDYTRFSRAGDDGFLDELVLKRNGVKLISINEEISDDFGGKLTKYIKFLTAEDDLIKIKRNTMRSLKQNALLARHNGGTPPFGYDVDPETKKYILNEHEAIAVRLIFEKFASGATYNEIIKELNALGYRTKRNNNEFKKTSVHEIIKNKKYYGLYQYGKINKLKSTSPQYKSQRVESESVVEIENGVPAIISKALWEKANANMKKRQPRIDAHIVYNLHGKIKCAYCGNNFIGSSRYSREKSEGYYICSTKSNKGKCINRAIKRDVIEKSIKQLVLETYLSKDSLETLSVDLQKHNETINSVTTQKEIKHLKERLNNLSKQQERLKEAYLNQVIDLNEFKKDKDKLDEQKHFVESNLKTYNSFIFENNNLNNSLKRLQVELSSNKKTWVNLVDKITIKQQDIGVDLLYPL